MSLKKPDINTTGRTTLQQELHGTQYGYFDYNETFFSSLTNPILRAISGINPFAMKQFSDEDSVGFAPLNGNVFKKLENYPNSIGFGRFMPAHFNPVETHEDDLEANDLLGGVRSHAVGSQLAFRQLMIPRGCSRQMGAFNRCKMVNGSEQCADEVKNVMEICPTWALEAYREARRFKAKVAGIQTNEYRTAMEVSEYNQGRTVADISGKTYVHGTKKFLRPDSIWADDRYANVTLEEIEEAKVRYNARRAQQPKQGAAHADHGHESHDYAHVPTEGALYP